MLEKSQLAQTKQILQSIKQLGLGFSQRFSLQGVLSGSDKQNLFCCNQINLNQIPHGALTQALESLVYHEKEGMWAISMEREFKTGDSEELSAFALNSVVFVFNWSYIDANQPVTDFLRTPCYDERICNSSTQNNSKRYFEEIRHLTRRVPTNEIKAILTPYHLVDLVQTIFDKTDIKVIPVNACLQTLEQKPIELFVKSASAPSLSDFEKFKERPAEFLIKYIADSQKLSSDPLQYKKPMIGPNYLRGLQSVIAEFPHLKTFGVHLTRLPLVLSPNNSISLDNALTTYNKSHLNAFRVKLKDLSSNQLNCLEKNPRFIVIKENKDNIFCFAKPIDVSALRSYINDFQTIQEKTIIIQRFLRATFFNKNEKPDNTKTETENISPSTPQK